MQSPVRLDEHNEPQLDLAVIRARNGGASLPEPGDVLFLIGVPDAAIAYDRNIKLPLYARSGIPEAWIVDLTNETIERRTGPSGDDCRHTEKVRRGETFQTAPLSGLAFRADAVLG